MIKLYWERCHERIQNQTLILDQYNLTLFLFYYEFPNQLSFSVQLNVDLCTSFMNYISREMAMHGFEVLIVCKQLRNDLMHERWKVNLLLLI